MRLFSAADKLSVGKLPWFPAVGVNRRSSTSSVWSSLAQFSRCAMHFRVQIRFESTATLIPIRSQISNEAFILRVDIEVDSLFRVVSMTDM